jgi:hypothetical protein
VPLDSEKVPNNPLTGVELQARVLYVLRKLFEERLPPPLDAFWFSTGPLALLDIECRNDFIFGATVIYPSVSWKAVAEFHFTAPDVEPLAVQYGIKVEFTFRNITMPKHTVRARTAPPPLPTSIAKRTETGVVAFTVEEKIDNPNLVRVNSGLPITITRAIRPEPGEFIGRIERHDIQYDKTDYPEPPEPVVVDISAECRREWGVPEPKVSTSDESFEKLKTAAAGLNPPLLISKIQDRRQDKKPAAKYSLKDKTDLDAIGQEE